MAYSPYKMKGHTLPGIKQRPDWVKQAQEKKIMKDLAKNPKSGINPLTEGKKIDRKYGSKSPAKKALVGDQHNLPENLKSKIKASPSKMYGKKSPAKVAWAALIPAAMSAVGAVSKMAKNSQKEE